MGGSACIVGSAAISALRAPMHTKLICEKEEKRGWVGSFRIESRGLAAVSKKKRVLRNANASAEQVRNRGARNKQPTGDFGVAPVPYPGGGERGALTR